MKKLDVVLLLQTSYKTDANLIHLGIYSVLSTSETFGKDLWYDDRFITVDWSFHLLIVNVVFF